MRCVFGDTVLFVGVKGFCVHPATRMSMPGVCRVLFLPFMLPFSPFAGFFICIHWGMLHECFSATLPLARRVEGYTTQWSAGILSECVSLRGLGNPLQPSRYQWSA